MFAGFLARNEVSLKALLSNDLSVRFSYLTSGDSEGKVFIWDWRTHQVVSRWKAHDNVCIGVLWHPHEKSRMITAGWDNVVKMWI